MLSMEPNKEAYGAELPEPLTPEQSGEVIAAQPETQPVNTQPPAQTQPVATPVTSPIAPITPVPATTPTQTSAATASLIADDSDLIEKEWVEKAKAIVAQTAHDPNLQTKEVGKIRADYMQKRYNKQLKLEES